MYIVGKGYIFIFIFIYVHFGQFNKLAGNLVIYNYIIYLDTS